MQLDLSRDFLTWDNTEPVSYQSTRSTSSLTDFIPIALRDELDTRDRAGGRYVAGEMFWLLPTPLLSPGIQPKPADIVTDADGIAYTVLEVWAQCRDAVGYQVWRLRTIALAIAYDLREFVDIERAQIDYDAAGAEVKGWPSTGGGGQVLYKNLTVRVQDSGSATAEERAIQGLRGSYTIYLSKQTPNVTFEDRVVWRKNGVTYYLNITGIEQPDLLDQLPSLKTTLAL